MKKWILLFLAAALLTGCGSKTAELAASTSESAAVAQQTVEATATPTPSATPTPAATPETVEAIEDATDTAKATPEPTATSQPTPAPTTAPAPTEAPAAAICMSYGELPLNLSAGSDEWWQIDSTDSAYWAVAENINAMRTAGGLPALAVDDGLSSAAGARCESFVAGGAFDHSGMTTKSEICAQGGVTSASAVCTAWQGSSDHYSNIMRTDISSMGIGCWWCTVDGHSFAYWVVTFG